MISTLHYGKSNVTFEGDVDITIKLYQLNIVFYLNNLTRLQFLLQVLQKYYHLPLPLLVGYLLLLNGFIFLVLLLKRNYCCYSFCNIKLFA